MGSTAVDKVGNVAHRVPVLRIRHDGERAGGDLLAIKWVGEEDTVDVGEYHIKPMLEDSRGQAAAQARRRASEATRGRGRAAGECESGE